MISFNITHKHNRRKEQNKKLSVFVPLRYN